MITTVAVKTDTMDMLRHMREELQAESYDVLIRKMIIEMKKPKTSMFGAMKEIKTEFKREKLDRFD